MAIPTYLLIISITYSLGIVWVVKRSQKLALDRSMALDICLCVMLGGFLGARLFHILYEMPNYYWEQPKEIFKFWQGGFVFYGGAIGAF